MKPVKDYEDFYLVSPDGRVFSLRNGSREICKKIAPNGYVTVRLFKHGKISQFYLHRLVAQHFLSDDASDLEVNHINGVKTDNRVENLEWCTHAENMKHAKKLGLMKGPPIKLGESNQTSKLTESQVKQIRFLSIVQRTPQREIAKMFGVSKSLITPIVRGDIWRHVNG